MVDPSPRDISPILYGGYVYSQWFGVSGMLNGGSKKIEIREMIVFILWMIAIVSSQSLGPTGATGGRGQTGIGVRGYTGDVGNLGNTGEIGPTGGQGPLRNVSAYLNRSILVNVSFSNGQSSQQQLGVVSGFLVDSVVSAILTLGMTPQPVIPPGIVISVSAQLPDEPAYLPTADPNLVSHGQAWQFLPFSSFSSSGYFSQNLSPMAVLTAKAVINEYSGGGNVLYLSLHFSYTVQSS